MASKLKMYPAGVNKFKKQVSRTLDLTADLLAQEIDQEVPFKTGALSMSAYQGGRRTRSTKDTDSIKFINYSTPYAVKLYYGMKFNFTRDKHSRAKAFWGKEIMSNQSHVIKVYNAAAKMIGG